MANQDFKVRFWGVRGSIPTSSPDVAVFGGETCCVEMQCGDHQLIFDAGSGIRRLGLEMTERGQHQAKIFLTHLHYDHIIGLPFFKPLHKCDGRVDMYSGPLDQCENLHAALAKFMASPMFPVGPDIFCARLDCYDFTVGDVLCPYDGVEIHTASLNHPGGATGYRVEFDGKAVAYITDTEQFDEGHNPEVLALARDADLVIHDCMYTDAEMPTFKGYGHSSWENALSACEEAGAKRLAVFHHRPTRSDLALQAIEAELKTCHAPSFVARQDMEIDV